MISRVGTMVRVGICAALIACAAGSCDGTEGEGTHGGYFPSMNWGPASNSLYSAGSHENTVDEFCYHLYQVCGYRFESDYHECLQEWRYYAYMCPSETGPLLDCLDPFASCNDHWIENALGACMYEYQQFSICMESQQG